MTTSFQVHGKVIHFSDHGDHATVGVAVDAEHEGNANLVQPGDGEPAGSPFLTFKVGQDDRERAELREGSDVTLSFAAAKGDDQASDSGSSSTDPAKTPKSSASK